MGLATTSQPGSGSAQASLKANIKWIILAAVAALNGYVIILMYASGEFALALLTLFVVVLGLYVFGSIKAYSFRYIFPAITAMVVFIIFPLIYTIWMAFTNYSGTNLLTLQRVQLFHQQKTFPVEGGSFSFDLRVADGGQFQFILKPKGEGETLQGPVLSLMDNAAFTAARGAVGEEESRVQLEVASDALDLPKAKVRDIVTHRSYLQSLTLLTPEGFELTMTGLRAFAAVQPRFTLLDDGQTLRDNQLERNSMPNMETGFYEYVDAEGNFTGERFAPGFIVGVGWYNFAKVITDKGIQGPFIQIFIWTVIFATLTVVLTLALGMVLACLVQWEELKGKAVYRVLLILPYAVPAFISILIFKGLFNQNFGEINALLSVFGLSPNWFTDPFLAKTMIIIVNTWLGYPYMMILSMGMLKAIPEDLYEASAMDGAGPIDNFFKITLPLVFKPMIPLLIASFAFNFNNFVLIQLLTDGRPDIIGSNPSAGSTDILVSYTFRIAFEAGGATDYGLAGAIATAIFIVVGALALLNLKLTKVKV